MSHILTKLYRISTYVIQIGLILLVFSTQIWTQEIVDKTVATVSDGVRTELITYSDLLWQIALEPNIEINPPTSENLNLALQSIIEQRLIALEAKRLPREAPSKEEIDEKIRRVLVKFPSNTEFVRRLNSVGFTSITDDNFQRIMEERVAIDKYVDFRFRSFVFITPEEEKRYYRDVFTPRFRRENPGLLMPSLEKMRPRINQELTEQKVATEIENFLDNAKERVEIIILSEV